MHGYTSMPHASSTLLAPSAASRTPPPLQPTRLLHCCSPAPSAAAHTPPPHLLARPRRSSHAARPLRSNAHALSTTTQLPPPLLLSHLLLCCTPLPPTPFQCHLRLRPTRTTHAPTTFGWEEVRERRSGRRWTSAEQPDQTATSGVAYRRQKK